MGMPQLVSEGRGCRLCLALVVVIYSDDSIGSIRITSFFSGWAVTYLPSLSLDVVELRDEYRGGGRYQFIDLRTQAGVGTRAARSIRTAARRVRSGIRSARRRSRGRGASYDIGILAVCLQLLDIPGTEVTGHPPLRKRSGGRRPSDELCELFGDFFGYTATRTHLPSRASSEQNHRVRNRVPVTREQQQSHRRSRAP